MGLGDLLTEDIVDPVRRDLMALMRRVDALPSDGIVQHPESNACKRRRSQCYLLRKGWALLWPDDALISQTEMSKALNLVVKELGPGQEGEMVLDAMFNYADAPHNGPVRAPRGAFLASLRNGILPPPPPSERPVKPRTPKVSPTEVKQAETSRAPEQVTLVDEQVDQAYRDAGFEPRRARPWGSTPEKALDLLERLKQNPGLLGREVWTDDRYKPTSATTHQPASSHDEDVEF